MKDITPKYLKLQKKEIIYWSHRLTKFKIMMGFEGNISIRLGKEIVLITKSMSDKRNLDYHDLVLCRLSGEIIPGFQPDDTKISSEFLVHQQVYQHSPETRAVIHGHPPYAILMTITGNTLQKPLLAESLLYFNEVPIAPFAMPGSQDLANGIIPYLPHSKAILLSNHGAVTHGEDLEQAGCYMEMLEKICAIQYKALINEKAKLRHLPDGAAEKMLAAVK